MYLSLSAYEVKEDAHNKIGEFFAGVKMKKNTKFYVAFLIFRRTIFVIILVCLASISSKLMISILGLYKLENYLNIVGFVSILL